MYRKLLPLGFAAALPVLITAAAVGEHGSGKPTGHPGTVASSKRAVHASAEFTQISDTAYRKQIEPLLKKYCYSCHSSAAKIAGLDLEKFRDTAGIRADLKPWQSVVDHLEIPDMPPPKSPQPSASEVRAIQGWVRALLKQEAQKFAGDPGSVPLRRLSNTEYDCTIRDITGVDLHPAAQFPTDGAAGEGFTNASEALTDVSPVLFAKYMAAARDIATHAVLLPDGVRFSTGATRRDWTDASTARLRAFYSRYTDPEGKVDLLPYLKYMLQNRSVILAGGDLPPAGTLNKNYLSALITAFKQPNASYPLSALQQMYKEAGPEGAEVLLKAIESWKSQLWQSVRVGSYMHPVGKGYALSDSRQLAAVPATAPTRTVRVRLTPRPGQPDAVLTLAGADAVGGTGTSIVWRNPRFEAPGKPPIALRDLPTASTEFALDWKALFSQTPDYLAAVIEAVNSPLSVDDVAVKRHLNPTLLERWVSAAALPAYAAAAGKLEAGRLLPASALSMLSEQNKGDGTHAAINGWHAPGNELPALITNSSDRNEQIPGDAEPHSVMVHPTPTEFAGVVFNSPISGKVRVSSTINHAHNSCGNGIAWWIEKRHAGSAELFREGRVERGGSAHPSDIVMRIEAGDQLLLAIDAKDGDHSCDLTRIAFRIAADGGATWDLTKEIADNVLTGNPHADSKGTAGVWQFVKGPTRPVTTEGGQPTLFPSGSILQAWRDAASDPARTAEAEAAARKAAQILSGTRPAEGPDSKLYDLLVNAGGPLLASADYAGLPHLAAGSTGYVLPSGLRPGPAPADIAIVSGGAVSFHVPAALAASREFVADVVAESSPQDHVLLASASYSQSPDKPVGLVSPDAQAPLVAAPNSPALAKANSGFDQFRALFPLYMCFPNVIPNDEVVSLKMFHREDEPLKRLMLSPAERAEVDKDWQEHLFISRQADAENKYLPLFIGFVTQDQPKEMVSYFEGLKPDFAKRAADFLKTEEAAIPSQLKALKEFTERAYRRPLTGKEADQLQALYRKMRADGTSHDEAYRALIARTLSSPSFLFRIEQPGLHKAPARITDSELASRLSYFLWSSAPDAELSHAATSGVLRRPGALAAQAKRMMKDARTRTFAIEFGAQWLHVRGFDRQSDKNEKLFPTFDESLRGAVYEETIRFFQDMVTANRPVTNLLSANYTYLNQKLAEHYGIPGVKGDAFRLVEGVQKYGRGGILGFASVQASQSGASRTSPILRGNWVSETLLGERLPRPPANVPKLPEEETGASLTVRQQVERHSKDPACYPCHRRIDAFGYTLEKYDTIGRLRDKDLGGRPLNTKAVVRDGTPIDGLAGLRTYLNTRKQDQVMRLFCKRLLGYALGRAVINSDMPLIDQMANTVTHHQGTMSDLILLIINSPQFQYIRGSAGASAVRMAAANPASAPERATVIARVHSNGKKGNE